MSDAFLSQWRSPDWLAEVAGWAAGALAAQGEALTGPPEQLRQDFFTTIVRLPAGPRTYFCKATHPALKREVGLTLALADWAPAYCDRPVAADPARGWLLLADGGLTVRQAFADPPEISWWREILRRYAALQLATASRPKQLLTLGLPDRRPDKLPALYDWLLADESWLRVGQAEGLTATELAQLHQARPKVIELCEELAGLPIPAAVHHNDLHDGNIFFNNGDYRFFDWGDADFSHPFFSLRTAFVSIEGRFGWAENDPRFAPLAREYLACWRAWADEATLWRGYTLAQRLWALSTAAKYKALLDLPGAPRADQAHILPAVLQEFLAGLQADG
ncbi:MAG: phosphotransferase [Anaerolineales bacterium]|nr:phosphotransferase [Anaerolineales bacterium]